MKIVYSKHAEFQMKQRDIPKKIVSDVVKKSENTTHRSDRTLIAQKRVSWHSKSVLCRVIYRRAERGVIYIITTYITTKIDKYNL